MPLASFRRGQIGFGRLSKWNFLFENVGFYEYSLVLLLVLAVVIVVVGCYFYSLLDFVENNRNRRILASS